MNVKKPLFWKNKNLIALLITPLSIMVLIANVIKICYLKKNYGIKTICIGNIYVGGTGKTSLTIELNNILKKNSKQFL